MALHIEDAEIEMLAEELATRTGKSVPETLKGVLRDRMDASGEAPRSESEAKRIENELMAIGAEASRLPDLDPRSPDELIGYDEAGLPS